MHKVVVIPLLFATLGLSACLTPSSSAGKRGNSGSHALSARTKQRVELVFSGPWSFAIDTANNRIVAIAPDMKGHSSLFLRATKSLMEIGGIYDIVLPGATSGPATTTPNMVADKIATSLVGILEADYSGTPYIINLPLTNTIRAYYKDELNHSNHFPVSQPTSSGAPPTFVTKVVFEYVGDSTDITFVHHKNATDTSTESLASDGIIDVAIDDDPDYSTCDYGAKGTFKAMTQLSGVTRYVNYPDYNQACDAQDPQHPTGPTSRGMEHRTSAGSQAIAANLLGIIADIKAYLDQLRKNLDGKDKEDVQRIGKIVDQMKVGIAEWKPDGATSEQKRDFVLKFNELQTTVRGSTLSEPVRAHLLSIDDELKIYSASGKNCKAPLMLLTVTP